MSDFDAMVAAPAAEMAAAADVAAATSNARDVEERRGEKGDAAHQAETRTEGLVEDLAEGQPGGHPWRWWILAVVLMAEVLDLLDATVVNVAAPSIRADLGGALSMMQWIAAGYTLAFAVLLVIGGRLGDRYGRRRMFLVGAVGFTTTSV